VNWFSKFSFSRLTEGLSKTRDQMVGRINRLVKARGTIDEEALEEIEEILIAGDVGMDTSLMIVERIRERVRLQKYDPDVEGELEGVIRDEIQTVIGGDEDPGANPFAVPRDKQPYVIMVVGVNGAGKTTSVGKLANHFKNEAYHVVVGAADTYRAAANEQLEIWAQRAGVELIRQDQGSDPAAVAYDAIGAAKARGANVVLVDTAGRLHTRVNLMEELKKIKRVMQKHDPEAPHEILLVVDGSTGQNAIQQARLFNEAVGITGLIVTKLDGTAKGGIIFSITRELQIPVRFIGVGERLEDLQPFDRRTFVGRAVSGGTGSHLNIRYDRFELRLRHPFRTARGSSDIVEIVIVEAEHEGITGYGEASPSSRYNETCDSVVSYLRKIDTGKLSDPFLIERNVRYLESLSDGDAAARAAIDIAMHDWVGKALGRPLHLLWGLSAEDAPVTSFTIGIDAADAITAKVREAEQYPILKIKLGGDNDEEILRAIRAETDKAIRVDVNEGWDSREAALEKIKWLEKQGVEFIEQPFPSSRLPATAWLKKQISIPVIADENVVAPSDVPDMRGVFDGINIKLMKCGGLNPAMKMIHTARSMGLKVMLGCMIESSIAVSAAAQLSPLADYADLDGNLLVTNDPFRGVGVEGGRLLLPQSAGIGAAIKGGN
jgi:signal recognition particle-docking protein FtsY